MSEQVEVKQSAIEIEIRALFKDSDNLERDDMSCYSAVATDSKGRKWFASHEHYCRMVIRSAAPQFDLDEETCFASIKDENDRSWTAFRLDTLQDMQAFSRFYLAGVENGDGDVIEMLDDVTKLTGITTELPTEQGAELSRIHYLLAMKVLDRDFEKEEKPFLAVNSQTKQIVKITNVGMGVNAFMGPYLYFSYEAAVVMGKTVGEVDGSESFYDPVFVVGELPFTPATAEDIEAATARGRELADRYVNVDGYAHVQYEGLTFTPGMFGSRVPRHVKSRVVVDGEGCKLHDTRVFASLLSLEGLELQEQNDNSKKNQKEVGYSRPTDEMCARLLPCLVVFDLTAGRWCLGYDAQASQIVYRSDAFAKVVMDQSRKDLVRAISQYHNEAGGNNDLIDGKGGGNIILLDGAPGTGKTLTAEATAEELKRVLYKVSLGELGSGVERLESALNRILALAQRWQAVLLIDEADVFLERRTSENLARNAVVAVFLRLLEYFGGLLFLTTNRGDNLDEAFLSRVTVGLHFQKPGFDGRLAIWKGLLSNAGIDVEEHDLIELVDFDVNGREIKNAINVAKALAGADKTPVKFKHLNAVLKERQKFFDDVKKANRG